MEARGHVNPAVLQVPGGVLIPLANGFLSVRFLAGQIVKVQFALDRHFFDQQTIIDQGAEASAPPPVDVAETSTEIRVASPTLVTKISRADGAIQFSTPDGKVVLAEAPGGRTLTPTDDAGKKAFQVRQIWLGDPKEALYGLGQLQIGTVNIKGFDLDLWQHNTNIVVPFLVSSKGYGILWDNTSFTRFGDLSDFVPLPAANLLDASGKPGGLSMRPLDGSTPAVQTADITPLLEPAAPGRRWRRGTSTRWDGYILAPETGDYQIQTYSDAGIKVWIDGAKVIDHWRQGWLAGIDQVKIPMVAGRRYALRMEWTDEQGGRCALKWKLPAASDNTSLWSQIADGENYTFVYGSKLDDVVAGYRFLTGRATMAPQWAFGLWQSRQRYVTSQESLDAVKEFRNRQIPFDNIVQDWMYWPMDQWGSHKFDPERFPDPDAWIKQIHGQHAHLMISVWGKFYPGTDNFDAMQSKGYLYQPDLTEKMKDWIGFPYTFYDAFNPGARQLFWSQINQNLFKRGIDAWWMDASEPDLGQGTPTLDVQLRLFDKTAMGSGARMLNGYALMNSMGMYQGQRETAPNQRVFILTRSGFAGMQHYGAAVWSGDITSTWSALKKQIPAGLGISIAGYPYWTTDTGGYTMQRKFSTKTPTPQDEDEWRELNARWFEFSTFCPLLRVHGELRPREMWTLGEGSAAYNAELKFDRLRYRMFPYVYSLAGAVNLHGGSFLRPLVMDFPGDAKGRELTDEYMFGPSLLVAPVTDYQAKSRQVYLPRAKWYDFWTGRSVRSGTRNADAPLDSMPLFVRAGSILPFGPELQYIAEKPSDPITLYVYEGSDGAFSLYEDDGLTYNYESGAYTEIPLSWNDRSKTLTIGNRIGHFEGMLTHRTFQIVKVSNRTRVGFSFDPKPVQTVAYDGKEVQVKLP
jgi:alpha-D-xyloside xylohydrolase